MRCMVCGGPFHPASGHVWQPGAEVCGPCIRHFYEWVKGHCAPRVKKAGKMRGGDFYAEAATSIRAIAPTPVVRAS